MTNKKLMCLRRYYDLNVGKKSKRLKASSESSKFDIPDDTSQVLLDLVNGIRDLEERVSSLEQNFNVLGTTSSSADEDAILETQLHVARLSAELSRLTVELRGKISVLSGDTGINFEEETMSPSLDGDEAFSDLASDSPVRKQENKKTGGWQPLN